MRFRERKMTSEDSLPFIKLKDGESISGSFAGDPYEFYQHWKGGRSVICPGKDTCASCKEGDKGTFRFRLNLIVKEGDVYVAKVFEQGGKIYDYLRDMDREYKGLERVPVKITRKGTEKNTSYVILPQAPFTSKQLATLAKVPLLDLTPTTVTAAPAEQAIEETVDDMPF